MSRLNLVMLGMSQSMSISNSYWFQLSLSKKSKENERALVQKTHKCFLRAPKKYYITYVDRQTPYQYPPPLANWAPMTKSYRYLAPRPPSFTIKPSLTPLPPSSTIRQVPDHQEVYLSATGFSSLIVDLGERVTHTSTDEEALRYHFDDTVDDKDTKKIWSVDSGGTVKVPNLP